VFREFSKRRNTNSHEMADDPLERDDRLLLSPRRSHRPLIFGCESNVERLGRHFSPILDNRKERIKAWSWWENCRVRDRGLGEKPSSCPEKSRGCARVGKNLSVGRGGSVNW